MPYRSIFLAPEWQHVRYLGWQDDWPHPDFRVMSRKQGPVTRKLVVSGLSDAVEFGEQWNALLGLRSSTTEIVLHDLTHNSDIAQTVEQAGFVRLGNDKRLLNIATFVIDLTPDEETLFAALSTDTRRKVRKAEKSELQFRDDAHLDPLMVAQFIASFQKMAGERALSAINANVVERMIADGMSRLFVVEDANTADSERSFLLSYETDRTGFFLYGASDRSKQNDGAGQLLQWGAINAFKAAGLQYYDMGGLPSTDSSNGIYRFKNGFGGELIDLGAEYGWSGSLVKAARAGRGLLGRLKGNRR